MAHKTLINGTVYEVDGGKTLINGTAYEIANGKTSVGGTAYEIGFTSPVAIPITADMYTKGLKLMPDGSTTSDGGMYTTYAHIDVSDLPDTFTFVFENVVNTNIRVAQYDADYVSLSDSFGIPWLKNKTSYAINKLDGCKYIRICSGTTIIGKLQG